MSQFNRIYKPAPALTLINNLDESHDLGYHQMFMLLFYAFSERNHWEILVINVHPPKKYLYYCQYHA
jgi:hypothetical protein